MECGFDKRTGIIRGVLKVPFVAAPPGEAAGPVPARSINQAAPAPATSPLYVASVCLTRASADATLASSARSGILPMDKPDALHGEGVWRARPSGNSA